MRLTITYKVATWWTSILAQPLHRPSCLHNHIYFWTFLGLAIQINIRIQNHGWWQITNTASSTPLQSPHPSAESTYHRYTERKWWSWRKQPTFGAMPFESIERGSLASCCKSQCKLIIPFFYINSDLEFKKNDEAKRILTEALSYLHTTSSNIWLAAMHLESDLDSRKDILTEGMWLNFHSLLSSY